MPPQTNVVVDGSNIATEGRSTPSLRQLDQAVRQYLEENPGANVTVVVDASFGHRIDPSEHHGFEEAVTHGELVSPPAGAIGRGDAFLLRIAERIGAQVLSNDSFREFHAEHPWLFDEGRLMGATPVPGVGWIFSPRRPVRGPLTPETSGSRRAKPQKKTERASKAEPQGKKKSEKDAVGSRGRGRNVQDAIAQATEEALGPGGARTKKGTSKPRQGAAPDAVNDPLPFITFVSDHPIGSVVEGTVVTFTSHGAMAQVGDMLCYVPLAGLGIPAPRRARDVLEIGEKRSFELVALDPSRRGAQLALPEVAATEGVVAEPPEDAASEVRRRGRPRSRSAKTEVTGDRRAPSDEPPEVAAINQVAPPSEPMAEVIPLNPQTKAPRRKRTASVGSEGRNPDTAATASKSQKHPASTKVLRVARLEDVADPVRANKVSKLKKTQKVAKTAKVTRTAKVAPPPAKASSAVKKTAKRAPKAVPAAKTRTTRKIATPAKAASTKKAAASTKAAPAKKAAPKTATKSTSKTAKAGRVAKVAKVARVKRSAAKKRP